MNNLHVLSAANDVTNVPSPLSGGEELGATTRSHIRELKSTEMSEADRALVEESRQLQQKIVAELSSVDNSTTPEITPDMIRVVEIAQQLSGKFQGIPANELSAFLSKKGTPTFKLGFLKFGNYSPSWADAFNQMIDQLDPDHDSRLVS